MSSNTAKLTLPKEKNEQRLLTTANVKILKSDKLNYHTVGLHLSPYKENSFGKNICPKATKECIASCLNTAGHGKFDNVQIARRKKTDRFIQDPIQFLEDLYKELHSIKNNKNSKYYNSNVKIAVRLNLTSDLPWENLIVKSKGKNLMDCFPDYIFYDYTKLENRVINSVNYFLCYSFSGENETFCKNKLKSGDLVSVVFNVGKNEPLPSEFWGYKVIDADLHDLRFLDKEIASVGKNEGLICGLRYKKPKVKQDLEIGKFVININKK